LGSRYLYDVIVMPAPLALLSRLLLDRQVCADCIGTLMAIPATEIEPLVVALQHHVVVRTGTGTCRTCGKPTVVHWLYAKDADPAL